MNQSLAVIDYERGPVSPQATDVVRTTDSAKTARLVECDEFVLERTTFSGPITLGGDDRFHIVCLLSGEVAVANDPSGEALSKGQTVLLPATSKPTLTPSAGEAVLLDAYLP